MQTLGFHHLAISVRDLPRAVAFYRDLLGLKELSRHHRDDGSLRSVWLEVPPGFLALEESSGEPPGAAFLALRIAPGDRASVVAELARAGFPLVHETKWTIYVS